MAMGEKAMVARRLYQRLRNTAESATKEDGQGATSGAPVAGVTAQVAAPAGEAPSTSAVRADAASSRPETGASKKNAAVASSTASRDVVSRPSKTRTATASKAATSSATREVPAPRGSTKVARKKNAMAGNSARNETAAPRRPETTDSNDTAGSSSATSLGTAPRRSETETAVPTDVTRPGPSRERAASSGGVAPIRTTLVVASHRSTTAMRCEAPAPVTAVTSRTSAKEAISSTATLLTSLRLTLSTSSDDVARYQASAATGAILVASDTDSNSEYYSDMAPRVHPDKVTKRSHAQGSRKRCKKARSPSPHQRDSASDAHDLSEHYSNSDSDMSVEALRDSDHGSSDEQKDDESSSEDGDRARQRAVNRDINFTAPNQDALFHALDSDGTDSAIAGSDDGADDDYDSLSDISSEYNTTDDDNSDLDDELFERMDEMDGVVDPITDDADILRAARKKKTMREWQSNGWDSVSSLTTHDEEYPNLFTGQWGPSPEVAELAENPLALFFFFFPRHLFQTIANESNRYAASTVIERARKIYERQKLEVTRRQRSRSDLESKRKIRERLRDQFKPILPVEYVKLIGMMIARMLCPHQRRLACHWTLSSKGLIPPGSFGRIMSKDRFNELIQHMHFSDNDHPQAKIDRIWIRPIVETLQETFARGYRPGPFLSFDEGIQPSRSKFNPSRMYLKDKPHKWGTKLFLTCCADSAYCLRVEVYCGKKALLGPQKIDNEAGPSAVIRNLAKVLPADRVHYHVVVMGRFFTSVSLALELLVQKIYVVGTVQTRRVGFPNILKDTRKKRPKDVGHGSYAMARSTAVKSLVACRWWDNKAVFVLATGASLQERTAVRKRNVIPCPKVVLDYHRNVGGVDKFDQLRLQRYSVQLAFRFQKYYKTWAFSWPTRLCPRQRIRGAQRGNETSEKKPIGHGDFLAILQAQLINVQSTEFDDGPTHNSEASVYTSSSSRNVDGQHYVKETDDWFEPASGQPRKRMARGCKVCNFFAPRGKKGRNTKFYCPGCSHGTRGQVYLCPLPRHEVRGLKKTCFQIWHDEWACGKALPDGNGKRLVFRAPTGKKRRRRQGDRYGNFAATLLRRWKWTSNVLLCFLNCQSRRSSNDL